MSWSRCARPGARERRTQKRKPKLICPAPNRGDKKEPVALAPVINRHRSGAAAVSFSDRNRAITRRKFPRACDGSRFKSFVDLLRKQTDAGKVLIVSDSFDEKTFRSARNVKRAVLATASDVNTEQLLAFEKILVTPKALEKLAERSNPPAEAKHPARGARK